ncbi:FAD-binding oxidoreductase [Bradyrhizobium tropiciagri]|uniref:FAD-binding oxidoreductase n=1 Tax=Bradyrhizobium tropiciagri TaxID=312253 RepID=UPI00067E271E|nr:FAD-binding oxidoreductase [Bradyrhizobium tropiciagri]
MQNTAQVGALEGTLSALRAELRSQPVLAGTDVPPRNSKDWNNLPQFPLAVVRPLNAIEVAEVVLACRKLGLPFVAQGGMTGLCGGAVAAPGWVAISLERMVGIEEVDRAAGTMTVAAGTALETVQNAADEAGLFFPLDVGSRGSCSIGGNLSTNAGGNRVIRYGMARDLVLGVEVVLPDGTIITSLNKLLKNNAGYDLKQLFIGSEGTLGIITRAVLRLFPKPRSNTVALCRLADYQSVVALLHSARDSLGPQLSAFEVMWSDFWTANTTFGGVRPPLADGPGYFVLVEAQGTDEVVDRPRFEAWLGGVMDSGLVADATLAQSLAQVQHLWAAREAAELGKAIGPRSNYDIGLPLARMDEFASICKATLSAEIPGCESIYFGHIADGNLHLVAWMPGQSLETQPKCTIDRIVYGLVRKMDGSISAEHGIGTSKKQWLGHARSEQEIALMRKLKAALDPDNLLNPGKIL